jgi:hypothetical protein
MESVRLDDGVVVYNCLVFQGLDGSWWATRDRSIMCSNDRDELLLQVADVTGRQPDIDDLRGRLDRAIERAARQRAEDDILEARRHGKQPT